MSEVPPQVSSHLPMNPRDYLVLFCLQGGPRHGYGIISEVEDQSNGLVKMDPSNLYRGIRRLIREDLLEETEVSAPEADGVKRRYYSVTALGLLVVRTEAERLRLLSEAAEARHLIAGWENR